MQRLSKRQSPWSFYTLRLVLAFPNDILHDPAVSGSLRGYPSRGNIAG